MARPFNPREGGGGGCARGGEDGCGGLGCASGDVAKYDETITVVSQD